MAEAEQRAFSTLHQKILSGDISAGEKISEVTAAEMLGVSRTPAKLALARLEVNGLLEKLPGRGYAVREVKLDDVEKVLLTRGVLEGVAAGYMATHGVTDNASKAIQKSLRLSGAIIKKRHATLSDVDDYQEANTLFHSAIMEECGNEFVLLAYDRLRHLPLAELGTVAPNTDRLEGEFLRLSIGHAQHTVIHDAITNGDAMRAEMVMREHSHATIDYARLFVGDKVDAHVPSLAAKGVH